MLDDRTNPVKHLDSADVLAWYDRHRRALPWRALPGEGSDPYRVWLSEIMLQQTTVKAVAPYFARFLARWPSVADLASADIDEVMKEWAGLGYYSRARNLHACARAVTEAGGTFPDGEEDLRRLPGIGAYTAAAIAAIAFGRHAAVVDGNIERVITRTHAIATPLPSAKAEIRGIVALLTPHDRPGDFAQAMMDLGATICTPKNPACALCPWMAGCQARRQGDQLAYPVKAARPERPLRRGVAFWASRPDGYVLLRKRPDKGLLGGMTEIPSSPWATDLDPAQAETFAPLRLRWHRIPGVARHGFTHFELELTVLVADAMISTRAPEGCRWARIADLGGEALPTVMRKVVAHALGPAKAPSFRPT